MRNYTQYSPVSPAPTPSSKAVLFDDEIADNARILSEARARSTQARAKLLSELPKQTPHTRRANRYNAQLQAEALREDGPVASILKANKQHALDELSTELNQPKTPADLDSESRDYDALQAAYDHVTGQLDRAFSARHRNYDKIEALSQQQAALSSQLMQEAM